MKKIRRGTQRKIWVRRRRYQQTWRQENENYCIWGTEKRLKRPDWCGLEGWRSSHRPKGCRFNSQSGHKPGLRARSPPGACMWEATDQCLSYINVFLPLFLPPFCSKNKIFNNDNQKKDWSDQNLTDLWYTTKGTNILMMGFPEEEKG